MTIFELFSKRQKILRGEVPEVYQYEKIPNPLRVQIVHIIRDAIGIDKGLYGQINRRNEAYEFIHTTLCREYGVFTLGKGDYGETNEECILDFLLHEVNIEKVLDVVELTFRFIENFIKINLSQYKSSTKIAITPDGAVEELNERFKEHGVGYQFVGGVIIRVDSTYIHSEVVKPVLNLLWNNKFQGANDEYLHAHENYRQGKNKECLKAFESTMKIICKEKGWSYDVNDAAKKLINVCLQNNLIPNFTQNQFTSLRSLLESGIPTIRNKLGGHGQGQTPQKVDDEMTRYALNLTGSNIIFLIEQSGIK
ncbi:MAG: hypothetical protein P9L89_04405 [Candidatus Celaenobacter polaris]|nr:hypothetical protein [Candidatus Celaenobacter polaris]